MNNLERVCIYIDGSNLYNSLKNNGCADMKFDFGGFARSFVGNRKLQEAKYYIGEIISFPDDDKSMRLRRHQRMLFEKLKKMGFYIIKGQLLKIGNVFIEKGVDVKIAIDMVEGAYEDRYDSAILITSDGDLAPAIEMVVRKNKKVEIVGFENRFSYALMQKASIYHSVKSSDLQKFVSGIMGSH
ncbi:NYN domain-containing protein [Candidatus Peregrinibacteria bacterium]|nr:NYN domain-containing protein [Candidatus Peregrinibacteria bacterium]